MHKIMLRYLFILRIDNNPLSEYNPNCKQEMTSPIQKPCISSFTVSNQFDAHATRDEKKGGALMYSDYGFVLEGIEYATESEAREALAEMQA